MDRPIFVARERELEQLDELFRSALEGQGKLCFITGEAGAGKTALTREFVQRIQEKQAEVVAAAGQCDAHTGEGDAYLPFREILAQLTGEEGLVARRAVNPENANRLRRVLQLTGKALVEVGPDLVGAFVPGVGLVMRLGAFVAERAGWLDRLEQLAHWHEDKTFEAREVEPEHIFEQYTNVLRALATHCPLVLVLDDLQWADAKSLQLLFRLGRRVGDARILLIGTYRPDEVALGRGGGRHPLEAVISEFKRYFGQITIPLEADDGKEGRRFVGAFLDAEPNRLSERFRQALCERTDGHPLFTVELLRNMQERGDLIRDEEGRWVEGSGLDWSTLPARVEGVIQERIGRLGEELCRVLTVASVEGEEFTTEVIAQVRGVEVRKLVRQLSQELQKQHRLVRAEGLRFLEGRRLSLYRFQHSLFQRYLYAGLDQVERAYLHEDVGKALEMLYGSQAQEVAVQLAWHFAKADLDEEARYYLRLAGEQAAARFAHAEAAAFFSQALARTPESDVNERYELLMGRAAVYDMLGDRHAQHQDLDALAALADKMAAPRCQVEVLLRRAAYNDSVNDFPAALSAAHAAIDLAHSLGDQTLQAQGHAKLGGVLWQQGQHEAAHKHLETALAHAQESDLPHIAASCLTNLGILAAITNNHAAARTYFDQALRIHREGGSRRGEGQALSNLGVLASREGDFDRARACYEQALALRQEIGDRSGEATSLLNVGSALAGQHAHLQARQYLSRALAICREIGNRQTEGMALGNLGFVHDCLGEYAQAGEAYHQALDIFRAIGSRRGVCNALVHLSLLHHHTDKDDVAAGYAREALHLTRELGNRHFEAYALTNLGHALAGLGAVDEAADAYRQAVVVRQEIGQPALLPEPVAGLARLALRQGDLVQARACVEEILTAMETGRMVGWDEPLRVRLTCYQVLQALDDPRARQLLATAHADLRVQAGEFSSTEARRTFLEGIATHRMIMHEAALLGLGQEEA